MYTEYKLKGKVLEGGRVEIILPELRTGDVVDVLIRAHDNSGKPGHGSAKPSRGKPQTEMPTYADDD